MKIFKYYILISIVMFGLIGCGDSKKSNDSTPTNETRSFKVDAGDDIRVELNQSVTILGLVIQKDDVKIVNYQWTKDDKNLSNKASLVYTPTQVGKERLTLTATDSNGLTASDSLELTVFHKNQKPVVTLGNDVRIDLNSSVTLSAKATDSDGTITKYLWIKGNEVISNDVNYTYVPTQIGEDIIKVTVTDNDGAVNHDSIVVYTTKRAFITLWETVDKKITIPTNAEEGFDFIVDWGDGELNAHLSDTITHEYKKDGEYKVQIAGEFPHINFSDSDNLKEVQQWGDMEWTSMKLAFSSIAYLEFVTEDRPNLSNVTDMSSMFEGSSHLNFSKSLNNWDVSSLITMDSMFAGSDFNEDISEWNVSNVVTMTNMFVDSDFNQELAKWNVSSVKKMNGMFQMSSFNQNISDWNVSNVLSMRSMFAETDSFNQDISSWDISSVTDLSNMFFSNFSFSIENYSKLLENWSSQSVQSNLKFDVESSYLPSAQNARDILTNDFNWIIEDGGLAE